jgi:hypothetical protein
MKSVTTALTTITLVLTVSSVLAAYSTGEKVTPAAFVDPPIENRPGAFWPWLNGSVSLERITYELEEMKAKGMSGADIWDVKAHADPDNMIPAGPTFLEEESLQAIAHTVKEGGRLGLRIGMLNSSGWNAGGTWTTPDISGMGLFHSQVSIEGPSRFSQILPFPEIPEESPKDENGKPVFYKEISVLAVQENDRNQIGSISDVRVLTEHLDANGKLSWNVPAGKWTIIRMVMSNTGSQLIVPSPNSGGPMIDFLNPDASRKHFAYIVDKLQSKLGDLKKTSLKHLEVDSLELGDYTVWTEEIIGKFKQQYGYDPLPYLPLLKDWKLKDDDIARRFEYDWKKHISDVFIASHYKTSSELLNEHGLKLCAEAGGPGAPIWDSCPVDSLKALGSVDMLRGEFWPKMRNIWLVKEISSAAHIYGKKTVDAESFTSWRHWTDGPYFHKQLADAAMTEGLNHFSFHTFTHSPAEAGLPGRAYHAGTHINPNVVWWPMAGGFINYLSRCCYMLDKGTDERTKLDYIHRRTESEDIYFVVNKNERWESVVCTFRVTGKQPEIWYPDSGEIRALAVYETNASGTKIQLHLRPAESLFVIFRRPSKRVHFTQIVDAGQMNAGSRPVLDTHSATPAGPTWLSDGQGEIADQYITFDLGGTQSVDKIRVWNYIERRRGLMNYGIKEFDILASADEKDYLTCGSFTLKEAASIEDKQYHQDFDVDIKDVRTIRFNVKTNHNTTYYCNGISKHAGLSKVKFFSGKRDVSGVTIDSISSGVAFDPATDDHLGSAHPAAELLTDSKNSPYLRAWKPGTYGIDDNTGKSHKIQVDAVKQTLEMTGDWQVEFPPNWGAPEKATFDTLISWIDSDNDGIKYFSGRAVYRKEIDIPKSYLDANTHLQLDLGVVQKTARVSLNGHEIALLWKPPFTVDITGIAKPSKNELVVEIANTWTNRLLGDVHLPPEKQFCKTNLRSRLLLKERRLQASGLIGPVRINAASDIYVKPAGN